MSHKKKILGVSTAIVGAFLIYTATAFVIPFPTEFLTLGISSILPGGQTLANIKIAFIIEWIFGLGLLITGILIYHFSADGFTLKAKRGKK